MQLKLKSGRMSVAKSVAAGTVAVAALSCASGAMADAVEWRVADGGNGHWYEVRDDELVWPMARAVALELGGDLASLETAAEFAWAKSRFLNARFDVILGGLQVPGAATPSADWEWLTGSSVNPAVVGVQLAADDSPCGCGATGENGEQDFLHSAFNGQALGDCNVEAGYCADSRCGFDAPYLIEWSADCNNNGVVDFGEIRNGLAVDTNGNNIPDECECANDPSLAICCPEDIIEDGAVNAIDLAAILNTWGTDGGKFPRADVDGSGTVDGADLAAVLSQWGLCE